MCKLRMNIQAVMRKLTRKRIVIICVVMIAVVTAYLANRRLSAHSDYIRGTEHARIREYEEAIWFYSKAIEIEPRYKDAYYGRALAYVQRREYDRAILDFSRVIALAPNLSAYVGRAMARYQKGHYEQVIRDCDKVIRIRPGYAKAYSLKGLSFEKLARTADAIDAYESCLKHLEPGQPPEAGVIRARIEKLATSATTK